MSELILRNRQKRRPLDLRFLRRIAETLLEERLGNRAHEIGLHVVEASQMAELNERYVHHAGSTDVITFHYADPKSSDLLFGDVFICIDDAVQQAKTFRTSWQTELIRYFIHGVLHLQGFDDVHPAARREMKRVENGSLASIGQRFRLSLLERRKNRR